MCYLVIGRHKGAYNLIYTNRLQQTYSAERDYPFAWKSACQYEDESDQGIHHQNFACEKACVDVAYYEKQQKAPAEPEAEILALHSLVVMLYEKAESEKQ